MLFPCHNPSPGTSKLLANHAFSRRFQPLTKPVPGRRRRLVPIQY
jgi:hypothetical protein